MIPGFVDLQVNGFKGIDFSSPELERGDFIEACRDILSEGTCAFLPTLITGHDAVYERNLKMISGIMDENAFRGQLPGIHLEGPFLSPADGARGAHDPKLMIKPDIEHFKRLNDWAGGKIKLLTIAADIEGAEELAAYVSQQGITVSLGHHMALSDDLAKLREAGARSITHLGNALPHEISKHDNPIWASLANDRLSAMIITDGHHISPAMIKVFVRTKGVARTIVVSDASPVAGLPPGKYNTMSNEIILEKDGRLHNPEKRCLVGSSATMLECMNYLASLELMSPDELRKVGFYNPLALIGVDPEAVCSEYCVVFDATTRLFEKNRS